MYYSYVEIEYIATSFSPARMDLALKLLMDLYIDTLMCLRYHILYVSFIVQKGFIHGHDTLPLHGKNYSEIDKQTEVGSKRTPPTIHTICEVEKKEQR
jgi:hypothetical protein